MKRNFIKKTICLGLLSISLLGFSSIGVSAEWKQDSTGWWYAEGNSYATGWRNINNKWYYFNNNGYMVTNNYVGNYFLDNNGVWVQNTNINSNNTTNVSNVNNVNSNNTVNNITNNINNGEINNTNLINNVYVNNIENTTISKKNNPTLLNSTTYNTTTNPYTNLTIAKKQFYDGKNGFKEVDNNKYVYYENGIILNNCWKEFDDGIRYFNENGIMVCDDSVIDIILGSDGRISLLKNKSLTKEDNRLGASGAVGSNIVSNIIRKNLPYEINPNKKYSIEYIKYMTSLFNIELNIEYKNVYDKNDDGQITDIKKEDGEHVFSRIATNSLTVYIGQYSSRLNLN